MGTSTWRLRIAELNGRRSADVDWCRRCLAGVLIATLLTMLFAGYTGDAAGAQESSDTVRIVARKLEDGRIEFGLQQRLADNSWSDRLLPSRRFFPTTATVGRWLASSPLNLGARIVARKLDDGRVEFGLQQRSADNSWSDRLLPSRRFFPTTVTVGRWLASSPLTLERGAVQGESESSAAVADDVHAACRPRGTGRTTAGIPLPAWSLPATGTLRISVLFLDFPDAPATHSTVAEVTSPLGNALTHAENYLEAVSYGKLDLEFVPLHRWLRAARDHDRYNLRGHLEGHGDRVVTAGVSPQDEAARLADPHVDFSDIDMMLVILPSSHFEAGHAGPLGFDPVVTEEKAIPFAPILHTTLLPERPVEPRHWSFEATHEIAHNFGLIDLYSYADWDSFYASRTVRTLGDEWIRVRIGLMGLNVYFPVGGDRIPGGYPYSEMLAWVRWQLGWLDTSQVRCITEPEASVVLRPAADPGGGTAMAVIPLSDSKVIVVESRRAIGYDAFTWESEDEGVLVYTVDATREPGALPIEIAGDAGDGTINRPPFLTSGQSTSLSGYTITVRSATSTTDMVTVTRSG